MKILEQCLREAFTEEEIAKEGSKYPDSTQRPRIYKAMISAVEKALNDERERIWKYLRDRHVNLDNDGAVVHFEHVARATNALGETDKWLKENGVI